MYNSIYIKWNAWKLYGMFRKGKYIEVESCLGLEGWGEMGIGKMLMGIGLFYVCVHAVIQLCPTLQPHGLVPWTYCVYSSIYINIRKKS